MTQGALFQRCIVTFVPGGYRLAWKQNTHHRASVFHARLSLGSKKYREVCKQESGRSAWVAPVVPDARGLSSDSVPEIVWPSCRVKGCGNISVCHTLSADAERRLAQACC